MDSLPERSTNLESLVKNIINSLQHQNIKSGNIVLKINLKDHFGNIDINSYDKKNNCNLSLNFENNNTAPSSILNDMNNLNNNDDEISPLMMNNDYLKFDDNTIPNCDSTEMNILNINDETSPLMVNKKYLEFENNNTTPSSVSSLNKNLNRNDEISPLIVINEYLEFDNQNLENSVNLSNENNNH